MLITGRWLQIEPFTFFTLYTLTLLPLYGIGYALAGLSIRFKNISSIFPLLDFIVLFLETLPVDRMPWLNVFPVALGVRMLLQHAREGTTLLHFPLTYLSIILAQIVGYISLGLIFYTILERSARERGLLAHY